MNSDLEKAEVTVGWQFPDEFRRWALGKPTDIEGKYFIREDLDMVLEFREVILPPTLSDMADDMEFMGWPGLLAFVLDTGNARTCLREDGAVVRPWGDEEGEFDLLAHCFSQFLSQLTSTIDSA